MDLSKGDMLIFSGEGDAGNWERYCGKRDKASIRRKLSRERSGGDRWASAWIELEGLEDAGCPGAAVYGELGVDLDEIPRQRAVPAAIIRDNPAAMLRAGKASPQSAANGAKGGRPPESLESAIKAAAKASGRASSQAMSLAQAYPDLDEDLARSEISRLKQEGIDGDWGDILDYAWRQGLPEELRAAWDALDDGERRERELEAVRIAKAEQARLDILALENWLELHTSD